MKILYSILACLVSTHVSTFADTKPNIVYILADDLGWGDVQHMNPDKGKIPTPHMDQLCREGMYFTDAHTTSSVCTPSRYSIVTGRYNWRSTLQQGVTWGYSPALIQSNRATVASFLKDHGYKTACIGKWHIGMDLASKNGKVTEGRNPKEIHVDWNGEITNGPTDIGFDYYWGLSASLDMSPYAYIEGNKFIDADYLESNPQKRPKAKGFDAKKTLADITDKTVEYIEQQSTEKPFFIYVPLTSPHTPILPTEEWEGKSGLNKYADFVMQTDAEVGRIVEALKRKGFGENTLVIVTSDNGCSNAARIPDLEKMGHYPNGQYRGAKKSIYEGGHRVPFIVWWKDYVKPGQVSDQLICQTDLMATCADMLGVNLPETAGEDSVSFLPALTSNTISSERKGIAHHSYQGEFAYRSGKWKIVLLSKNGGAKEYIELYDMKADPYEKENLYETHTEIAQQLLSYLKSDVERGRSTAGPELKNDVAEIELWKKERIY